MIDSSVNKPRCQCVTLQTLSDQPYHLWPHQQYVFALGKAAFWFCFSQWRILGAQCPNYHEVTGLKTKIRPSFRFVAEHPYDIGVDPAKEVWSISSLLITV